MKYYSYIFDYTPYWKGGSTDKLSRILLNFKKGHANAFYFMRSLAVNYFDLSHYDKLRTVICAVPGHNPEKPNQVQRLCGAIAEDCGFIDGSFLVTKLHETDSFCRAGIRDADDLRESIKVDGIVAGLHLILIDDVATTGTSFKVVSDLLIRAGAASVRCVALGQTVKLSERRLHNA
jgi:predicted amidophosphoribosyltransferase